MKREIAIGTQDFEFLRMNNGFYVDKTDFIREWWKGLDAVTLITRPRRFGKTLNMSMLNCFFSNKYEGRDELFEGLKVWDDPAMREEQGKWPVISLSFADVKTTETFTDIRNSIEQLIMILYSDYSEMMRDSMFSDLDREMFAAVGRNMDPATATRSLQNLCRWMEKYYGKKVLIFLDEYDTPLQEAYVHGYWKELTAYIRSLFNSTFKSNPSLARAIMTGITRVSKESIFSDLKHQISMPPLSALRKRRFLRRWISRGLGRKANRT